MNSELELLAGTKMAGNDLEKDAAPLVGRNSRSFVSWDGTRLPVTSKKYPRHSLSSPLLAFGMLLDSVEAAAFGTFVQDGNLLNLVQKLSSLRDSKNWEQTFSAS
jgi:hypothetical protein